MPKAATTLLQVVSRLDGMLLQVVLKPVTMLEHLELKLAGMPELLVPKLDTMQVPLLVKLAGMQVPLALKRATMLVSLEAKLAGMLDPLVFKAVPMLHTTLVSKLDRQPGELVMPVYPVPRLVQTSATMLALKLVKPHGEQPILVSTPLAMFWEELISDSTWVWEEVPMPVELVVLDSEDRPALVLATKVLPR